MMVVKTFVSELSKKIEMLHNQIEIFEKKVSDVKLIEEIIEKSTLKQISEINGDDLALISEDNYKCITEIINFNNNEENINKFIEHAVTNRLYAKLLLEGKVDEELKIKTEDARVWLEKQATHIKEFIIEFKASNESYLNNLKQSDNLYQKYLSYFQDGELISVITNIDEFNDVLKKSGLIAKEKWELLKFVAKQNIILNKSRNNKDNINEIKLLLENESYLLNDVTEQQLDFCMSLIEMDEQKIKELNLSNADLIKYQKIAILYNIKTLYEETLELISVKADKKIIEKNKKDLNDFKDSYMFFEKIN